LTDKVFSGLLQRPRSHPGSITLLAPWIHHALTLDPSGFWANVNPAVPHPRWSQAFETSYSTSISSGKRIPSVSYLGRPTCVQKK